jgi:hypothetical protein
MAAFFCLGCAAFLRQFCWSDSTGGRASLKHVGTIHHRRKPGTTLASIALLDDHDCAQIQGGVSIRSLSFLTGLQGRGNSFIFQSGRTSIANIGSTGISLISIGGIYF